ncbi:unnamed protein product, partial [Mesorhabditis belari]|uniref:Integrase zinc-binding domain-containing protein n=1 Tax=Mesorhabditis belari TaxID=2138241 RepID=A0AAF3EA78_9BILA
MLTQMEDGFVEEELDSVPLSGQHHFLEEEAENLNDYGGMDPALYEAIVEFKKFNHYPRIPQSMDSRGARTANCHWRLKCNRFLVSEADNETLLYYNPNNTTEEPKVVVKKGEVKRVIERIHELIGHLGMKRTQYSIMRKLYWRSVRQDVRNLVNNCQFCVSKKVEGKKIMKAPVDIMSEDFDLNIVYRSTRDLEENGGERLLFSLKGIDEEEVRLAAVQRMTTYTFKETTTDRPPRMQSSTFRRQPYVRKSRFSPSATGFLLPFNGPGEYSKKENNFIEVYPSEIIAENDYESIVAEGLVPSGALEEEVVEEVVEAEEVEYVQHRETWQEAGPSNVDKPMMESRMQREIESISPEHIIGQYLQMDSSRKISHQPSRTLTLNRNRNKFSTHVLGAGGRFSGSLTAPEKLIFDAGHLVNSYEETTQRVELCPLAPIMFLPSTDSDVIILQKELLERQRKIQLMQQEILQAQLDALHS